MKIKCCKTNKAFRGYAVTYKKDPLSQLKASKSDIKDLFNDLLDETKGFKYQITVKILLKNTLKLNFLQSISIQQQKQ